MKLITWIIIGFISINLVVNPVTAWWDHISGPQGSNFPTEIMKTNDGGYIIVGTCHIWGPPLILLWKVNSKAINQNFWWFGNDIDDSYGNAFQKTKDSGYVIVGSTNSFIPNYQIDLLKTNEQGKRIWERKFGGKGDDFGKDIHKTNDGGFIMVGNTYSFENASQIYLVKTDAKGKKMWERNYGGSGDEFGNNVLKTKDNGFLVIGNTNSFGNDSQVYLVKVNAKGRMQWEQNFGGSEYDMGNEIQKTNDGGYIIIGSASHSPSSIYLIKINATGCLQWESYIEGRSGNRIKRTGDGGFIILGDSNSQKICLIKTNATGFTQWYREYGRSGREYSSDFVKGRDGGYMIVGYSYSAGTGLWASIYFVKTDKNGL